MDSAIDLDCSCSRFNTHGVNVQASESAVLRQERRLAAVGRPALEGLLFQWCVTCLFLLCIPLVTMQTFPGSVSFLTCLFLQMTCKLGIGAASLVPCFTL